MKVAIVAKSPASRYLAPFDDPDFQIWTVGALQVAEDNYTDLPRVDRWYELHALDHVRSVAPGFVEWLIAKSNAGEMDVWTRQAWPDDLPNASIYPVGEIVEQFGSYFTNSVSWMIAHALHEGCTELHLYGVDMAHDTEYWTQRPSCEWLLGWAQCKLGRDKVVVPDTCDLLKAAKRYGFDDPGPMEKKLTARELELDKRAQGYIAERDQNYQLEIAYTAQTQFCEHLLNQLNGELLPDGRAAIELHKNDAATMASAAAAEKTNADSQLKMMLGAKEDCRYWASWFYDEAHDDSLQKNG